MKKSFFIAALVLIGGCCCFGCLAQEPPAKNKSRITNYHLALYLAAQKKYELTQEQNDALYVQLYQLDSILNKNPNYDHCEHERTHLQKILNEKQYDIFLGYKNISYALSDAQKAWKILKDRNLTEGYDSTEVVGTITDYRLERLKLFDRYAYDDRTKYDELAGELYRNFCPNALRLVNQIIDVEEKEKSYQGNISK